MPPTRPSAASPRHGPTRFKGARKSVDKRDVEGTPGKSWPERKVTELIDQIKSGGEDYQRLVERLPAIVYSSELGEQGRWRYVSPQIEEILGYSPDEWLEDPGLWARLLHPEDRERALSQETTRSVDERNPPPIDYRMITRDGEVVWILDEAELELDEEGTPIWHGVL